MTERPHDVMETYSASHLHKLLVSNQYAFDLTENGVERLLSIMDEYNHNTFIANQWDSFARDNLGESGDTPNYYATGDVDWDVSEGKQAWLLKDGYAVSQKWLDNGDGRVKKATQIDVTDTEFVDEKGVCWFPKDYMFICHVTDEAFSEVRDDD